MLGGHSNSVDEQEEFVLQHDEIYGGQNDHFAADVTHMDEISLLDPLDNYTVDENKPKNFIYKKLTLYDRFIRWYDNASYEYFKESALWMMESATIELSVRLIDIFFCF